MQSYKDRIDTGVSPDPYKRQPLEIGKARRAITQFAKASDREEDVLDLMLHFVECGTEFTANHGDISGKFYESMIAMFERFANKLEKSSSKVKASFRERAYDVVNMAAVVGWGYHEASTALYDQAYPEDGSGLDGWRGEQYRHVRQPNLFDVRSCSIVRATSTLIAADF